MTATDLAIVAIVLVCVSAVCNAIALYAGQKARRLR